MDASVSPLRGLVDYPSSEDEQGAGEQPPLARPNTHTISESGIERIAHLPGDAARRGFEVSF